MNQPSPINVLISLHRGYGLGDAVQMSAVLRHVVKYRTHWTADLQAEPGRHCVGRGIVSQTFAFGEPYPRDHYDCEVEICLYDTWSNFHDRPNTRVSSCLHERFGLAWDPECARYRVDVSDEVAEATADFMFAVDPRLRIVALHYQGDSSQARKNLLHSQAAEICNEIVRRGRVPLLLDWRGTCPVLDTLGYRTTLGLPESWGGDAEKNCAVISQCEAFVGIDSGPSKCASATETPALVVWTGHHPAPFHDPAPNTTHLVPRGYHGLEPVCNDPGVIEWFESHYNVRQYAGNPVVEVKDWLREVLE